ncbi:uncharacterized protein MELLADRAFT_91820 [Melampsora larici-populina 98AG31]|uniref:Uncharacterized protein n=1 Tax=Melampsora larici-populina (strain 98AG31 / pathotype 3-4-7) TaxID=747676 RepID=F4S0F8_MELLP|nr:uncharacterized protein MELLADRAFT_91820 [Melampsora larici-populina 98AG31]EGG01757.1 hypothetical protein MELLADRAFT_91820 [Melampsora larici-populina 98AG31]
MSPLKEEFPNFGPEFGNFGEHQSPFASRSPGESSLAPASRDGALKIILPESRIQPKLMDSGGHSIQVSSPSNSPKPWYKWLLWSAPVFILLAWSRIQLNSTPRDNITTTQTVSDVTSQLKAVVSKGRVGGHAADLSIKILDSIEDLQEHAAYPSIDSSRAHEVSDVLESQINVPNSTVTAEHLRQLIASVDCVYDSLRRLNGRGLTELRVLMEEFSWFKNFHAVENTDKFIRSMFDHQYKTFTLLANLAEGTGGLIQKTHSENEKLQHDLFSIDCWLRNQLNRPFYLQIFNERDYHGLQPLLDTVILMVEYTRDVRKYLEKMKDTISTRWAISNKPNNGTIIQVPGSDGMSGFYVAGKCLTNDTAMHANKKSDVPWQSDNKRYPARPGPVPRRPPNARPVIQSRLSTTVTVQTVTVQGGLFHQNLIQ